MARRSSRDIHSDAPPTAVKDPNPAAASLSIGPDDPGDLIGRTVTINAPRQALYAFWRDFRNLPLVMENIESVQVFDERRSHWRVKGPAESTVEWDSLIIEDITGEVIAWTSTEEAEVPNSGRIEFRDTSNGRGTQVTVNIVYDPPVGTARQGGGQTVRPRAEHPGTPRPAPVQAAHGNRRNSHLAITRRNAAMRALTWQGKHDVRVETVPDPETRESARRDHPHHIHRDLRVGPAPVRQHHPGHEAR